MIEAEEQETESEVDNEIEIENEKEAYVEKARVAEEKVAQKATSASAPATSGIFIMVQNFEKFTG